MDCLLTCYEKNYVRKRVGDVAFEVGGNNFWVRYTKEEMFLTRTYYDRRPGLHAVEPSDRKQVRGQGKTPIQKAIWKL